MFGPTISSKARSTDTPPRCTTASTPSSSESTAALSSRRQGRSSSPVAASPRSAISLTRSESQQAFSRGRSTRPSPPAAPVSSKREKRRVVVAAVSFIWRERGECGAKGALTGVLPSVLRMQAGP